MGRKVILQSMVNNYLKKSGFVILSIVLLFVAFGGVDISYVNWRLILYPDNSPIYGGVSRIPTPTPFYYANPQTVPTPTIIPITPDVQLQFPQQDMNATVPLQEPYLVFGIKQEKTTHVEVFKKSMTTNNQEQLFSFDEFASADVGAGNFYTSMPASAAISPQKNIIAYTDSRGLHFYNLLQKSFTDVFTNTPNPTPDAPPSWRNGILKGIYGLIQPSFSPDGKYVLFVEGAYEGSNFGVYNTQTQELKTIPIIQGWIVSTPTMYASSDGYGVGGLEVGTFADLSTDVLKNQKAYTDISKKFDHISGEFGRAVFSSDDKKILFTFTGSKNYPLSQITNNLGIADTDGSNFTKLYSGNTLNSPLFSPDGKTVYFIEKAVGQDVLTAYDLSEEKIIIRLGLPQIEEHWKSIGWTKDGYLTLISDNTFSLLDIGTKKFVYFTHLGNQYTTYAGFMN